MREYVILADCKLDIIMITVKEKQRQGDNISLLLFLCIW